ncbi:EthD domain-containing protein [Aspergillus floccosus]
MPKALILATRKPNISPSTFRTRYEAHVELLKRISTSDFPLSHRRSYIARTTSTSNSPPENNDTLPRNASTPAAVIVGQQADIDFDAIAELTFADDAALQAFMAKVSAPEAAKLIADDEEGFSDRERLRIVMVGDVVETTN